MCSAESEGRRWGKLMRERERKMKENEEGRFATHFGKTDKLNFNIYMRNKKYKFPSTV